MSELLKPRDPLTDPRPGDSVLIGEHKQYAVLNIDGSAVKFSLLERGRRGERWMSLAAWRDRMAAATVVSVANGGVANGGVAAAKR